MDESKRLFVNLDQDLLNFTSKKQFLLISVLGPFKLEVMLIKPYRVVFHDFLSEAEMEWMIEYSKPRLSQSRGISASNFEGARHEFREGKRTRTVHKTVQVTTIFLFYLAVKQMLIFSPISPLLNIVIFCFGGENRALQIKTYLLDSSLSDISDVHKFVILYVELIYSRTVCDIVYSHSIISHVN